MIDLKFKRLHSDARLPSKAHESDAGWDLYAPEHVVIKPGRINAIPLGIAWNGPPGYYAQLVGRSGLARSYGLGILGGAIDPEYVGPWVALLTTTREFAVDIGPGERLLQFVLIPVPQARVVEVDTLDDTPRGTNGFGSTGA